MPISINKTSESGAQVRYATFFNVRQYSVKHESLGRSHNCQRIWQSSEASSRWAARMWLKRRSPIAIRAGGSFSRSESDDMRWRAGMYDASLPVEGMLVGRTCTIGNTVTPPWTSPAYTGNQWRSCSKSAECAWRQPTSQTTRARLFCTLCSFLIVDCVTPYRTRRYSSPGESLLWWSLNFVFKATTTTWCNAM